MVTPRLRQIHFLLLVHRANCSQSLLVRMIMHLSTSNHLVVATEFQCEENFWAACPAGKNIEQFTCPSDFLLVPDCRAGDLSNPVKRFGTQQRKPLCSEGATGTVQNFVLSSYKGTPLCTNLESTQRTPEETTERTPVHIA